VATLLAVNGEKVERHVEAGEQLPQLVGAAVLELSDDVEQFEAGFLILGPFGEELADDAVEILFEHPRLGDVIVGLAESHGLDDRAAHRVVALHQEHPFGQWVHLVCAREEIHSGHLAHVVVDDKQRHGVVPVGQATQRRQSNGTRRLTDDAEVSAEPPAEIVSERVHHPGVVIDHEQDGLRHRPPFSRTDHCNERLVPFTPSQPHLPRVRDGSPWVGSGPP
jgi:hypothetical protein